MEERMFALVWKTAFIYFLILLTLRFMGKREVGQLGLFDFVVLLLIADVSAITLDDEKSIYIFVNNCNNCSNCRI